MSEPNLLELFQLRFPDWAPIASQQNSELEIVDAQGEVMLSIAIDERGPTFVCGDAHAHLDSIDEAFDMLERSLKGGIRSACLYRHETLAATWMQVFDGEAYEVRHFSDYLCPFDADEYQVWPDEVWRTARKSFSVGSGPKVLTEVVESSERNYPFPDSPRWDWLTKALGEPGEGMKWTIGLNPDLVLQAPMGWRRRAVRKEEGVSFIDFSPIGGEVLLRVVCFYRDVEGGAESDEETFPPSSVEHAERTASEDSPDWSLEVWTLVFSDGRTDMMARLELWSLKGKENEADEIGKLLGPGTSEARHVPGEWNMPNV